MKDTEATPGSLDYWGKRDQWTALGRQIGDLRKEAKQKGVQLAEMPGAAALVEEFKRLGRELDRQAQ